MFTIRRIEHAALALYKDQLVRGYCHPYVGQEAIAVGIGAVMRDYDHVIASYRAHGWCYVMGNSLLGILAELTCRQAGCARGKGGSMHMYGTRFYGGNGIVGAQVPMGTGIAMACKYMGTKGVCFAANQGQCFESYNIACLKNIPVVYVCENNKFGLATACIRAACCHNYYTPGDYIPGIWVDGMDVLAVRSASEFAIDYAIENGPIILEMSTYRYFGHSMSDPGVSYRSREEVQGVRKKKDPIAKLKTRAIENGLMTEADVTEIDEKVKKEMNDAAEKAKVDEEIALEELTYNLYAKAIDPRVRLCSGSYGEGS